MIEPFAALAMHIATVPAAAYAAAWQLHRARHAARKARKARR